MVMLSVTKGNGLRRVVLPLIVPRSGPNIFSAKSTSAVLTGRSAMAFIAIAALRSATLGDPKDAMRA